MENQLILVADNDPKNLEILRENLEASGFLVAIASNGKEAWEEIVKTKPKLLLTEINLSGLSGFQLLEKMKNDPETANIPVVFLTKQRDVQQRLRAFELGVKDYLVKPLHVKEVIAHIRMILRRLKRFDADIADMQNQFSGKLEQLSLADLIESFGVERKTGILTLSNGRRSGQVFFRDGAVINARLGDFKMEQALYQMFPWKKGFFKMIFQEVDVAEEIAISNLGLLLQGLKRIELREKLIKQLPSPDATFVTTPVFRQLLQKKKLDNGVNEFTRLLDGNHTVEQIIDESNLDDLVALKRLVRLYQQGFITAKTPPKSKQPMPEPALAEQEEGFSQHFKRFQPMRPEGLSKSFPKNGKEERGESDSDGFEQRKDSEEQPEIFPAPEHDEKVVEPNLELRQQKEEFMALNAQEADATEKTEEKIDTNKSLFEEVFLKNKEQPAAEKLSEFTAPQQPEDAEPSQPKQPDRKTITDFQEPSTDKSILGDENIGDFIFQVTPSRREEDLEEEIKPLINEIEENAQKGKVSATEVSSLEAETEISEPELEKEQVPEQKEPEESFIDEELIRKVALGQHDARELAHEAEISIPEKQQKNAAESVSYHRKMKGDKVVLVSVDEDCKDSVMDILTRDNFKSIQVPKMPDFSIDIGKVALDSEKNIKLISVPIEKQLNAFLESIAEDTIGCLFTFDCSRPETWEYTGYLINSISDKISAPFAVLVMNSDEQESMTIDVIRYKLNLSKEDLIIPCDETDENCVKSLINILKQFFPAA